jgi:serine/threonine-protein phosphatase 5
MSKAMEWPGDGVITPAWARLLAATLDANSRSGEPPKNLAKVFPKAVHEKLMKHVGALLQAEPTLLRLRPPREAEVVVVGDTHGQLHDALKLMSIAGEPSETNWYVFNGDFVDRGAWGAELFAVALAWKAAAPRNVFLLRGNHECEFCTEVYGYKRELQVKYSKASGNALWRQFMRVGAELPLAAQIGDKTLVLHGGLFRGKKRRGRGASSRALAVGTLAELAGAWKGGDDPDGEGDAAIAGDVLWSDPAPADQVTGLVPNENRGIGTMFGPDATAEFLKTNGLSLVLRSHEGPDAREDREGMDNMHAGFSVDHDIENVGKLCTVFSAPDYPQFIEAGDTRHNNAATFVRLRGDTAWAEPEPTAFSAARPRPESEPYYDITVGGSDEEGPDGELARETRAAASGDEAGREETTALEEEAGPEAAAAAEAMEAEDDEGPTPSSQEDTEEIPSWPRSRPR